MTTAAPAKQFKITYTSANADMTEFHRLFDEALAEVKSKAGKEYPLYINGNAVRTKSFIKDVSPIDTSFLLGRFCAASHKQISDAVASAKTSQKAWGALPWQERVRILRRAAELVREKKFFIGALMSLEVGKSRMEAMGDAEESADLIDYYAAAVEEHQGFKRPLARLSPNENTSDHLRPFGVFACIAPFNFPMALSAGMSSAALLGGNAVVFKPSSETPWTGLVLYEIYREAGVPAGVFHYLNGDGKAGEALWRHPGVDGVVFTGSKAVGMRMLKGFSTKFPKPVLMESGGKNPCYVSETADLDAAAEGVMKSAFGLQGQKCSACSRVYVHESVHDAFVAKLLEKTRQLKLGDPSQKDVYFGPLIHERALKTFLGAVKSAKKGGTILLGGERLKGGLYDKGRYAAPTVASLPLKHELFFRELFAPFLAVGKVTGLDQALMEANKAEYGLTAGIFTNSQAEIQRWFDEVESGVVYANRRGGATTGAWPGVQSFCGWKGSGATGKGGCGPFYVQQFMREQSRTIME